MAALFANKVSVAGTHDLESITVHAIGAAKLVHSLRETIREQSTPESAHVRVEYCQLGPVGNVARRHGFAWAIPLVVFTRSQVQV